MANNTSIKTVSILGAGKVGIVLAQLALKAGYKVYIAGSGNPEKIKLSISVLAPGAHAVTKEEAAQVADVVILALPLSKYRSVPTDELKGKLVIDAMNHWFEVDGPREDTIPENSSSSEIIQAFLPDSTVVKALSHMGYHELFDNPKSPRSVDRKAIAIAADEKSSATIVSAFIDSLGFDPLVIGNLEKGRLLEPGFPAFGANTSRDSLENIINTSV